MITRTSYPFFIAFISLVISSCGDTDDFDAYGEIEADEVIISAEGYGVIRELNIEEGDELPSGQIIGHIDTASFQLDREILLAAIQATTRKTTSATPERNVLKAKLNTQISVAKAAEEKLAGVLRDQKRYNNLAAANAVRGKDLDDINVEVKIRQQEVQKERNSIGEIETSLRSNILSTEIRNNAILSDIDVFKAQLQRIDYNISRCIIKNPMKGHVLQKYKKENEMVSPGQALYKIANLDKIFLRAYITADQFEHISLNQQVSVYLDDGKGYRRAKGHICFIANSPEFTPQNIKTKNHRATLVYAVKVAIPGEKANIGAFGGIKFGQND